MKCKGTPIFVDQGTGTPEFPKCESEDWELIWHKALVEEGTPVSMYQCTKCKRIVMATEDWRLSDNWA